MMSGDKFKAFLTVCAVALAAVALPASEAITAQRAPLSMITGGLTSQPIGHYEFCQSHRSECVRKAAITTAARVTKFGWATLNEVNGAVNHEITPITDADLYGRDEVWAYPDNAGDCEDFVLEKRRRLMARGFSPADLLITVVRKPDGEGHAVLTVRTSGGDFILDNLADEIRPWHQTPYVYLKRQATFDPGRWVKIENGRELLVGALE